MPKLSWLAIFAQQVITMMKLYLHSGMYDFHISGIKLIVIILHAP